MSERKRANHGLSAGVPHGGPRRSEDPPRAGAPHWAVHLPAGMGVAAVDLAAGGTLAGAWTARWAADPGREVLRTADGAGVSAGELADRTATAAARYAAA